MASELNHAAIDALFRRAIREDAPYGDKTTEALGVTGNGRGVFLAKQVLVACGVDACLRAFKAADPACEAETDVEEGSIVEPGTVMGQASGPLAALLLAERPALNLLQRLCGIATCSRRASEAVAGTGCRVCDTRKTTPGLRLLEKYAVRVGGAANHRMGLSDAILIKDNHVKAKGSITEAVRLAKASSGPLWRVEVEVKSLAEFREAMAAGADIIMLDNMSDEEMGAAARERLPGVVLEASGNMVVERLAKVAATGVDLISMGALTHSAPASDISFKIEPVQDGP